MTKILIITKEINLSRTLDYSLSFNGFVVECAHNHNTAFKFLSEVNFNLILLDFNFKASNGVEFYKELHELQIETPIIAMGDCYDEVSILENMYHGLSDYILKPFALSELKMVVNKQLERSRFRSRPIVYGDLRIDVARSLVTVRNKFVSLGKKELDVLIMLTHKAGKIVARDALMTSERMNNLKKKLKCAAGETLQIKNMGVGYKLIME